MSFYSDKVELADRLLQTYGKTVVLQKTNDGSYSAVTGEVAPGSPTTADFWAATFQYDLKDIVRSITIDNAGLTIERGDLQCIASGSPVLVPEVGDKFAIDGELWDVMQVAPLRPGVVTVLYEIQLRK